MLATEPTESRQPSEPTEPIDRSEPAEPIDKMEPVEPIDRIDPLEPMLRIDPDEPFVRDEPRLVCMGFILAAGAGRVRRRVRMSRLAGSRPRGGERPGGRGRR